MRLDLLKLLGDGQQHTLQGVMEALGCSRRTAQARLNDLQGHGLIKQRAEPDGMGQPPNLYSMSAAAVLENCGADLSLRAHELLVNAQNDLQRQGQPHGLGEVLNEVAVWAWAAWRDNIHEEE